MDSDKKKKKIQASDVDPRYFSESATEIRRLKEEKKELRKKEDREASKKKRDEDRKAAAAKKAADKEKGVDKEVLDEDLQLKKEAEQIEADKKAAKEKRKAQKKVDKKRKADEAEKAALVETARKKVLVPIANGTDAVEAVVTIDVLRRANAKVYVASVDTELGVDASNRVRIVADMLISECDEIVFDLIALPGGPGARTLRDCTTLEMMVKMQAGGNRLCAAISTAHAIAFGSWGLLNGKKATCDPLEQLLSTTTATKSRVEDTNLVTSRGPGTAIEYAIELVKRLYGEEHAMKVSEELIVRRNPGEEYAFANINPVSWTSAGSPKQILVPIANGTEEMEVVTIVYVLRKAGAKVVLAFVEDKEETWPKDKKDIVASRDVKLMADMSLDEVVEESYDLIVLPGELGGARAFHHSKKLIDLMKKQKEANKPYGAICASSALVLEYHGLLEGKKATTHPDLRGILWDPSEAENRVVVDGYVATSQGPGTCMEYALVLVEKLFGKKKATEVAKDMVFF